MKRKEYDQTILLPRIMEIKADHPFWGYRRVWAYLKYRLDIPVNKKRVYRLMKEQHLLVKKDDRLRAKRDNRPWRSKMRAHCPNHVWGTDMTKIMIPGFGWVYMVIVLDWHTKKLIGYSVAAHSKTIDWLDALYHACDNQFPQGILSKEHELFLVSDNGSQPTSYKYMQACGVMEIKQVFASYNNPKGNADTERVMRTIKEDFIWTHDFSSPLALTDNFKLWVDQYNTDFPHSSLNYKTPAQYEKDQLLLTTKI